MSKENTPEYYKEVGNSFFSTGKYSEAVDAYKNAIKLDPENAVYYSNSAASYMKLGKWKDAIDCCLKGLNLKYETSLGSKLYFRCGTSYGEIGDYNSAEKYISLGLKHDANNKPLKDELEKLQPLLRKNTASSGTSKTKNWEDLKKLRENQQSREPRSKSKPIAETRNINIQIVDQLPEKFREPVKQIKPIVNAPPPPPMQTKPVVPLHIPSPLTFYTLMTLMRSTPAELPQVYNHLFFNVPPSAYPSIHQTGGIDYEVIEFILDSIIYVGTNASNNDWLTRAIEILDSLSQCTRFGMSKIFIASSKFNQLKELLTAANIDSKELSRIIKVYS